MTNLVQLTHSSYNHYLNSTQVFSPKDEWIVYDIRKKDDGIPATPKIEMVHTASGEIQLLYETSNQTEFGPGVGAVTFSPVEDKVLFIHGIKNANKENPYSFTRRTGVAIDIKSPQQPIYTDARNIVAPFTKGALRGGTHAHTWSGDGQWISFTYNDFVIEQLQKSGGNISDLRTIGVMVPGAVTVPASDENNNGTHFAVVTALVTDKPTPGSDEIEKAFDEGWIGTNGYINETGGRQKRAVAFQGLVKTKEGKSIAEVFVCDMPEDISTAQENTLLQGSATERCAVPAGVSQRRLTFTEKGVSTSPRHWLRSTSDGSKILFLAEDKQNIVQLFSVSPTNGSIEQVTNNNFPITSPFNISPDGKNVAYFANNTVFTCHLETKQSIAVTEPQEQLVGAPVWSNKGNTIAFNKTVQDYIQIFLITGL